MADAIQLALQYGKRGSPVQRLPVGMGDGGNIIGGFHTPFDFQRADAGLLQIVQMLDHAQIIAAEKIGAAFILLYGKILAGARLLHQCILPAAGLGAVSLVGVAAGQIGAEKAAPGVRHAHGPMHKRLQL